MLTKVPQQEHFDFAIHVLEQWEVGVEEMLFNFEGGGLENVI
jgi:hypothetical protein